MPQCIGGQFAFVGQRGLFCTVGWRDIQRRNCRYAAEKTAVRVESGFENVKKL